MAFTNGGFEAGTLTGWTTYGAASIKSSTYGSTPPEGTYAALLENGPGGIATATLEGNLGLAAGSLDALGNGTGAGLSTVGAGMKQTFAAVAGDTLRFDWNFLTNETADVGNGTNDFAFAFLISPTGDVTDWTLANTLDPERLPAATGDLADSYALETTWALGPASIVLSETGDYVMIVGVMHVGDTDITSGLLVDDFRLENEESEQTGLWTYCGEYLGLREWEIRLYDDKSPADGTRKSYGSEAQDAAGAVGDLTFEIQERGGYGSGSCSLLAGWDKVSLAGTERVDVWLWDAPAYRGYLRTPQRHVDNPEGASLTFYGLVALLDGYQVKRKLAYGTAVDLTTIFSDLATQFVKITGRFPDITIDADTPIGVTIKEYDGRGKSVAEAFNELCDMAPAQVIWGAEMDSTRPIPGDTLYMRPRPTATAYIYAIGDNVRALAYPEDVNEIANRLIIGGGPVEQPNVAINGGFESLLPASEDAGNLLLNESFEDPADPDVHWTLTGSATVQFPGNAGAVGSARTGDHWLELDEAGEAGSEVVAIVPGGAYTGVCWARLEQASEANALTLTLEGLAVDNSVVTTTYTTFNAASSPALDSDVYKRYTVVADWDSEPTVVKARLSVAAGGGSHTDDGVLVDDLGIYETAGSAQETWRAMPTGAAVIEEMDWGSTGTATTPPRSGGLCVHMKCADIALTADTGELYYLPSKSPSVQAKERYTLAVWWHVDGQGGGSDSALTIGAVSIDSDNNQGTVWESGTAIGDPSTWQLARLDIMTESTTARLQLFIRVRSNRDTYLDDVMLVQGELPDEYVSDGGFWTGDTYERTIDVEDALLTGLLDTDVDDSITTYGEREAPAQNELVTDLATMKAYAAGQFNARALPKVEARLDITAARELLAQAGKVRLINLPTPPPALWPARVSYHISPASIDISAELGNRRPDLQSLLSLTAERSRT